MEWLTAPHNAPFTVALTVVVCFALLEVVTMLFGAGLSGIVENAIDLPDADAGGEGGTEGAGTAHHGVVHGFMSWLEVGRLPLLVSLNVLLGSFALSGFAVQQAATAALGHPFGRLVAAAVALVPAVFLARLGNRAFGRLWPRDETSAVSPDEYVGHVGVVTVGTATMVRAAEVKLQLPHGGTHYLMVQARGEDLPAGTEVLIVARVPGGPFFLGERNTEPLLSPRRS